VGQFVTVVQSGDGLLRVQENGERGTGNGCEERDVKSEKENTSRQDAPE
jgi:hypothetical protein